ncbi:MAG: SRPBCC family protein [Microthrixaceae bacterium]|nr:SRPBCC family protein [Microthrixaceae bacterium]
MAKVIAHELEIAAPIERVWELTVDIERWPELTPTITSVERLQRGPLAVGSSARLVQPRQSPRVWTVTDLEAPTRFAWSARLGRVTMTGRHDLVRIDDHTTTNRLSLELSGVGAGVVARLGGKQLLAAIATENVGFKRAAETALSPEG